MAEATPLELNRRQALLGPPVAAPAGEEARLREVLKHFPLAVQDAAWAFRKTARPEHLTALVHGVIERYLDPAARAKLHQPGADLRLREDLDLDSLTLMEIALRLEDALDIVVSDDELRQFRTLGDVQRIIDRQLAETTAKPETLS
jgi:3-hydroxyacyl-[acyl-carrier-protein] dehydratase